MIKVDKLIDQFGDEEKGTLVTKKDIAGVTSGAIAAHNTDSAAHNDIRDAIPSESDIAGVASGAIEAHNTDGAAHEDIRDAIPTSSSISGLVQAALQGGYKNDTTQETGYERFYKLAEIKSPNRQDNSFWWSDFFNAQFSLVYRGTGENNQQTEYTTIGTLYCILVSLSTGIPANFDQLDYKKDQGDSVNQLNLYVTLDVRIVDGHKECWYEFWFHKKTNLYYDSNIGYCSVKNISYIGKDGDMATSSILYYPDTPYFLEGDPETVFAGHTRYAKVTIAP